MMESLDTSRFSDCAPENVGVDRGMISLVRSSSPWEKMDGSLSRIFSTTIAFGNKASSQVTFFSSYVANLQKELERCRNEKKLLEEQLQGLRRRFERNTHPVRQRVFFDNEISIRIKKNRNPVLKVVYENEFYSVCWHGIELGCSICRDGLLEEINQTLVFLWRSYVKTSDDNMTRSALRIRYLMQNFFEEI